MPLMTSKNEPTPVMLLSESADRLAISLAMRGMAVAYTSKDAVPITLNKYAMEKLIHRRHWLSYYVLRSWSTRSTVIGHRSGGKIFFTNLPEWIDVPLELEVRV